MSTLTAHVMLECGKMTNKRDLAVRPGKTAQNMKVNSFRAKNMDKVKIFMNLRFRNKSKYHLILKQF